MYFLFTAVCLSVRDLQSLPDYNDDAKPIVTPLPLSTLAIQFTRPLASDIDISLVGAWEKT